MPQFNPLDALKGKSPMTANDPANAYSMLKGLSHEARMRQAMEKGLAQQGDPMAQGNATRFGGYADEYDSELAESPMTGMIAQQNQFDLGQNEAQMQGFTSGGTGDTDSGKTALQSREIFKRNFEREKVRAPITQEEIRQKGGLAQQQEQSRGIVEQARIGADAKLGQAENLLGLLRGGGLRPGQRISLGGGMSINEPAFNSAPNAALKAVQDARLQYDYAVKNRSNGFFGIGGDDQTGPRKNELDQAINNFLIQHPADPSVKAYAKQIFDDPETQNLSTNDIIHHILSTAPDTDPDDLDQLASILQVLKNK